ncbi:hypothetical protein AVEN_229372-1 [Araneus ventricosus]|uniref:WAP domain-containing protein n=1 Tax=Araneus ventricosus TaxID=182803 RepID=A0A4Y2I2A1_ARAVE|nr:hypothetical protein AVEN_229372-1 [Araneus ventricosus]
MEKSRLQDGRIADTKSNATKDPLKRQAWFTLVGFHVFLYVGGCNARVVPLSFKVDKSKRFDSSVNELIDESPMDEVEILGHNLPDIGQGKDLELLNSEEDNTTVPEISNSEEDSTTVPEISNSEEDNTTVPEISNSEEDNTTVPEISNRNASNLSADLIPKEKAMDEESNLESAESSAISDLLEEKLNSTSEFISQNNSDSRDSFETIQESGILNDKTTKDLTFKNEASIINNSSSLELEQRNNLDLVKMEEKVLNDTLDQNETFELVKSGQNETFASFEVVNGDQNGTSAIFEIVNGTNSTDGFFELQPLSNDTKVEVFLSDAENITEKFKSNNLTSENLELTNDSVKTAGGIFKGFEFLINSEVARNAAKAMEVFNFSDPLTDHIMEENEFHSFLPAFNGVQDLDSPNQTDLKTTIITNSSGESNEIQADFNASLSSGDETSIVLNQADPEETKKDSSMQFNLSKPLEEGNETELFDLEEKLEGNVTSEVSSPLENSEEKIELGSETTISKENIKGSVSNSSAVGVPQCPPPGWCIFWFLSQDACAVNEHCLGSRICCKIRCSKTCIEVESLQ